MRLRTALAACALLVQIVLAGCASTASTTPARADGYLYRDGSELLFVRWDAPAGAHGTVDWYHGKAQRITADFTVVTGEGGFSFAFPAGSLAGWTGTVAGDGLSLVLPGVGGGLRTIPLAPASLEAFQAAAASLE
jgi:hypothetical protein